MHDNTTESRHILLADDDPEVRTTLGRLLELEGHSVVEACHGEQALELVQSQPFDLVITDYLMPRLAGDKLAIRIKRYAPCLPVIMITANADLLPTKLPDVDFLLPKPFHIPELRSAIRSVT